MKKIHLDAAIDRYFKIYQKSVRPAVVTINENDADELIKDLQPYGSTYMEVNGVSYYKGMPIVRAFEFPRDYLRLTDRSGENVETFSVKELED